MRLRGSYGLSSCLSLLFFSPVVVAYHDDNNNLRHLQATAACHDVWMGQLHVSPSIDWDTNRNLRKLHCRKHKHSGTQSNWTSTTRATISVGQRSASGAGRVGQINGQRRG